jgi:hypothetical protein
MSLNLVNFLWYNLGRARGLGLVLLLVGPLLVLAVLAIVLGQPG